MTILMDEISQSLEFLNAPPITTALASEATTYNVLIADRFVDGDADTATLTLKLPALSSVDDGHTVKLRRINSNANSVNVIPQSGEKLFEVIDGSFGLQHVLMSIEVRAKQSTSSWDFISGNGTSGPMAWRHEQAEFKQVTEVSITGAGDSISASTARSSPILAVTADASYTLTSTPTIEDPLLNGGMHELKLVYNGANAFTVTLQSESALAGSLLRLGAATRVLGRYDVLSLVYDPTSGAWLETAYVQN